MLFYTAMSAELGIKVSKLDHFQVDDKANMYISQILFLRPLSPNPSPPPFPPHWEPSDLRSKHYPPKIARLKLSHKRPVRNVAGKRCSSLLFNSVVRMKVVLCSSAVFAVTSMSFPCLTNQTLMYSNHSAGKPKTTEPKKEERKNGIEDVQLWETDLYWGCITKSIKITTSRLFFF